MDEDEFEACLTLSSLLLLGRMSFAGSLKSRRTAHPCSMSLSDIQLTLPIVFIYNSTLSSFVLSRPTSSLGLLINLHQRRP